MFVARLSLQVSTIKNYKIGVLQLINWHVCINVSLQKEKLIYVPATDLQKNSQLRSRGKILKLFAVKI